MFRLIVRELPRFALSLVLIQAVCLDGLCAEPPASTRLGNLNELVCGPRCVQFVLKHYGVEVGLDSLVREMQWPDFANGSSVRQIQKALDSRGVYTRSIQLKNVGSFSAPRLLIMHLRGRQDNDNRAGGHFVVVLPESTSTEAVVWDGLFGTRRESWADFQEESTGIVILTDSKPIEDIDAAIGIRESHFAPIAIMLACALALTAIALTPLGPRMLRGLAKGSTLPLDLEKSK